MVGSFIITYTDLNVDAYALMPIVAALCYALSNLIAKRACKYATSIEMAFGDNFYCFLLVSALSLATGSFQTAFPPTILLVVLVTAFACPFLGFMFYYRALKNWEYSKVAAVRTLTPFLTIFVSWTLLAKQPSVTQVLGGAIIVVGVMILAIASNKKSEKTA